MNLKNMRECDKSKNTCKQQLPIVYMSFNNVGHLITSTITTLQHFPTLYHTSPNYTSLHLSTLHFHFRDSHILFIFIIGGMLLLLCLYI